MGAILVSFMHPLLVLLINHTGTGVPTIVCQKRLQFSRANIFFYLQRDS